MFRPPLLNRWFVLALSLLTATARAALPLPEGDAPVLRIQGSNTIGAVLGPALVKGLMEQQGLKDVRVLPANTANEVRVQGSTAQGQPVWVEVDAHGSSTGFEALEHGKTDLVASSRPVKDSERDALLALGDLQSRQAEQVIAIDGVAIILHPDNPLSRLDTLQLAQVFSGQIHNWDQLGAPSGPIHLYARDDRSGTFETFKNLVLDPQQQPLSPSARRFESSEALSDAVANDRQGIGFIGLPYVRQAKPIAVADGEGQALAPAPRVIATEDYPLSRRLYFYVPLARPNPWAQALVSFAQSPAGQALVAEVGFVSQTVQAMKVEPAPQMPAAYQRLARDAVRLSVNFRFAEGSAALDNKAYADLQRLVDYLQAHGKPASKVSLAGFGDAKDDPQRATLLSKLRAMAVRRELARHGLIVSDVHGLGAHLPVADNDGDEGRIKNRRVEVWVR
ncbi:phosphate ABC transporter substrate-binding/OmpA family protein [Pseudomonas sp. R5(2019)]|uniref:phosphate ABC transporter substrate-binding/OmpA family protein n=1 Tax=Pseudomonas sp. R5(2019) TaxID=2697566 RepID=UPI00141331F2|nr:phosphate ABC transporter substrate-binding/OmpA family protein [Pseudomonas sp. R5(2019)]NBA98513.1 OmpA family protein [Pseudomonas sp. R5(2019)]